VSAVPQRLRPSRRPGIPLADAGALGGAFRRTAALRLALALALLALAAGIVLLARGLQAPPSSYFASGAGGIVVTDLSSSIDPAKYRRMARVFRSIADTNQPTGFVVFSDTAYEQLPPGTRGSELRPVVRFFEPQRRRDGGGRGGRFGGGNFNYPPNPWSGSFRGGTRVSTGLTVAREMIERDGITNGTVLLISDLDNSPFDNPKLAREIDLYERAKITLRIVPLFPADEDRALFLRLVGPQAFVANRELLNNASLRERRTLAASFPAALAVAGAALLLLLAVNERLTGRLSWQEATA
jgi:hypothetical protein